MRSKVRSDYKKFSEGISGGEIEVFSRKRVTLISYFRFQATEKVQCMDD